MKYSLTKIILIVCLFLSGIHTSAQNKNVFALNINNGLPINYAYCMLIDEFGYLWISTTKGVVRYNGYNCKLYNLAGGLPKESVWRLFEDKRGRIWFSSVSRELGYVKNNKFTTTINILQKTIYPNEISDYDSGICFTSHFFEENRKSWCQYIERNDTFFIKTLSSNDLNLSLYKGTDSLLIIKDDSIFSATLDFDLKNKALLKYRQFLMKGYFLQSDQRLLIGDNIVRITKGDSLIYMSNIKTKKSHVDNFKQIAHTDELPQIIMRSQDGLYGNRSFFLTTPKGIYRIDTSGAIVKVGFFDSLFDSTINGNKVSFYIHDNFWKDCISTTTTGVTFNFGQSNGIFKKISAYDLFDYDFIGLCADETGIWWNNDSSTLVAIRKDLSIKRVKCPGVTSVVYINAYSRDSSILITRNKLYWLNNASLKIEDFFAGFRKIYIDGGEPVPSSVKLDGYNLIAATHNRFFLISKGRGLIYMKVDADTLKVSFLNQNRFDNIVYDSLRDNVWVYSNDDIQVYHDTTKKFSISLDSLKALKIRYIEKIFIDGKYGNVILKDYDKLLVFNEKISQSQSLFQNYFLGNAQLKIYSDMVVVAGNFGVLFCKITGPMQFSQSVLYPNVKNIVYNYVKYLEVANNKVIITTDKGTFVTEMPRDNEFHTINNIVPNIKYTLFYNDRMQSIKGGDTIQVLQDNPKMQFDVINPLGNGSVNYTYTLKEAGYTLREQSSGDLILPKLIPGRYYTLIIIVHDKVWQGQPLTIHLFIVPNWWQKPVWIRFFWISGLILLIMFGYFVANITRKRVVKNNIKRNQQLELELKAIYSQINPHFIYNTLNSALLLIHNHKIEQAYTHISKFSKLLRSYVRSARNKYITVEEEVANLKNYIELQQARFKDKFNYEIIMAPDIDGNAKIPSLLLQPFVENAINHGLLPKGKNGNLIIKFIKNSTDNQLICIIEDNGIGRALSRLSKEENNLNEESYGNELIKDLISIFNKYEKMQIEIQYFDKTIPLSGTVVEIKIKDLNHE